LWQLVAVLWVAGLTAPDGWRALHLAVVPHVACPYDGVLMHEDELPAGAREAAAHGSNQRAVSAVPGHHHHSCSAFEWSDRVAAPITVSRPTSCGLLAVLPIERLETISTWPRPVLSYAPKLPPPA
jgi:hypothetical protein